MGIDTTFEALIPKAMTDAEIEALKERIQHLDICRPLSGIRRLKSKYGTEIDYYGYLEEKPMSDNETMLDFDNGSRYYGEGYERGNPLPFIQLAEYLEFTFPGVKIYQGGDSTVFEWTAQDREDVKKLYFTHGTDRYHRKFNK